MKRSSLLPRSISLWAIAFATLATLAAVAPGCGLQGEGERCEHINGNDDCNAGLVCKLGSDLGQSSDVCCPEGASADRRCVPIGDGVGGAATTTTTTTSTGGGGSGGTGGVTTGM